MRRMHALAFAVAAIVGFSTAAGAQALMPDTGLEAENERIDRFTAELIGEMLDTLGLRHTLGQGPFGEPAIAVEGLREVGPAGGTAGPEIEPFEVQFFGCDDDGRCDEMSLVSRYQPSRPTSLSTVNRFNQGTRFTTAFAGTEGELILSMDLSAVGGIGRQATMVMIAIYVYNMESFARAIGYS